MTKVNIREALNQMDKDTDCKYDLVTLYESCNLTEEDKKDIAKSIADKEDADVIYDKLVDKYGDDLSFDDDNINDLKFLDMSKEAYLYGEDNHDFEDLESGDNSDVEESFGDDLIDSQYMDDTSDGLWSWDYDDDELANIYGGDTRYDYHPDGIEESQNTDLHEGSSIAEDTSDRTSTESKEIKGYLTVIERDGTVVNESATDPRYYKMVEYNYDGDDISNYLGHVRVRTNSDKVALRAAEKYAMSKHPEDNPGHFKIVDDNYTNVDVIDSDGDYLTTLESVDESKSIKESSSGPKYVTRDIINKTNSQKLKDAYDEGELEVLINGDVWYTERCPKGLGKELKAEMKRLYPDIKHLYGESVEGEVETRKQNYLKAKEDFETLGEKDNNDVLSREEKMLIAKAEYEKVLGHSIDESLNEDTQLKLFDDDMINDIDILYQWRPEEVEKILVKHGANPNNDTWITGLDLPAAYDEIMSTFKDKYSDYDEIDYSVAKVLGLVDESLKEESSNKGWVKRWNFLDNYYKGDLVISKISSPVDAWHVEKVAPNGHTIKHLGNYKSLEVAMDAAEKHLIKNESKSIKEDSKSGYWYFTRHGVQPGSIPKGANVLMLQDVENGTYVKLDRVLTTKELNDYEIIEKRPAGLDESKSIKEALDKDLISVWLDEHEEAREDFINWVSEHPHLYNDLLRFCKVDEKSVIDKVKENRSKSIKEDTTNPTYSWMIVKMGGDGVHYYYNASENIFTSNIDEGTRYAEREAIEDDFNAVRDNNDNCYMRKIPDMPDWKPLKVFSTHIYNHYPFSGAIELMDKVDENGEGQKLKFTSRDKMNSKADELLDNGYISYTYKRSQDESLKESVSDKYPIDKLFDSYTIDYDEYRDRFSSFFFSLITKINKYLQKNHSTMTIETDDWNIYNDCEGITVYLSEMPEGPEKFFEVADLINSYLKTNLPNMFKTVRNKYMDKSVDIPFSASPIQAMISLNDYLDKRNIGESLKGSTYNDLRNLSKSEVVDLNESKSIKESFPRNIDLDQVVMQVANLVDDKVLGDNWIEIFPIRDARQSVSGESSVPLEITGPYDITKKATFRTRNGRVEVAFLNGSEAMCDNAESIARFIAGEFGLDLDGDTPLLKDIPNEQLKEEGLATDLVIESAGNNVTNKFIRSIVESQDIHEGTSLKRIARYNEFDNGNVLHNYEKMTSEEAEEKAKQASLDNPNDIYYVAYDDIMDSSSDLRWINGKSYNYSDVQIKGGKPYIKDASANESIEDNSIEDIDKFVAEVKEKFPGSEAIYDGDTHTIKITLDNIQKENLTEDSTEVDELETVDQKISSANTSINSSKLPAIFRLVKFEPDTLNLDYGGGKFDNAAEYLAQQNVTNLVYDPYNRSTQHNAEVLQKVRENGGADTITISNVLNVIAEPEARLTVLRNAKKLVKPGGNVYITVYEGNKSGEGTETKSGYQLNKSTADYIDEIASVFSTVNRRGKLIIAS